MPEASGTGKLVCGTAALGLAYGLPRAVDAPVVALADAAAAAVLREALAAGISIFDTAPAYGLAEVRLGQALAGAAARIWTKVGNAAEADGLEATLQRSLEAMRRPHIELLQWHNFGARLLDDRRFLEWHRRISKDTRVGAIGASTYGAEDARAAVSSGLFRLVQVEWNLLNTSVVDAVADEAATRGVLLAVRSVFLQGALTEEGRRLPPVPGLHEAVMRARGTARALGRPLSALALRAALDHPSVAHVVLGFDHPVQVAEACAIAASPPLTASERDALGPLHCRGATFADPRTWR